MTARPTPGRRPGFGLVDAFVRYRGCGLFLLVILVGLPFINLPWMMDDHIHLNMLRAWFGGQVEASVFSGPLGEPNLFHFGGSGAIDSGELLRSSGRVPWWTADGIKLVFWRPLTSMLAVLDYRLWPGQAAAAHLHSLLWYGFAAWAGLRLLEVALEDRGPGARRLVSLSIAVFVLYGGHAFLLAWVANRNALVATSLAFLASEFYLRNTRNGSFAHRGISVIACVAALAGGEIALSGLAFIPAHLFWVDRRPWSHKLRDFGPLAVVVVVWLAHYRWQGFGARDSGFYLSPFAEPGQFLTTAPLRWLILAGDFIGPMPADAFVEPSLRWLGVLQGLLALMVVALLLRWLRTQISSQEQRCLGWLLGGACLGLLPVLATEPSSRLLLAPSLARAFLIALLLRCCWRARAGQRWLHVAFWLGAFRHLLLAPLVFGALATTLGEGLRGLEGQVEKVDWQDGAPTRFLLNASDPSLAMLHHMAHRRSGGSPHPPHWHMLASTSGELGWRRSGDRSLELRHPQGKNLLSGMLGELLRGQDPSLSPLLRIGQQVKVDNFAVTVLALDGHKPSSIRLIFATEAALEQAKFYHWHEGELHERTAPNGDDWQRVPWSPGPLQR